MGDARSRALWKRGFVGCILMPAVLVSGCATMGQPTYATQDERRLAQLSEAYNETFVEGCVVGAAGGAAIGAAADSRDRALGALIGAAVGAVAGCLAGSYVGNIQNNYATEEDRLDAVVADVIRDNQALSNMIPVAKRVVEDNRAKIDQLDKAVASGRLSRAQAADQLDEVDAARNQLQSTLSHAKKRLADQRQAVKQNSRNSDPGQVALANSELEKKQQQIGALESELDTLTQLRSVSRVG